MLRFFADHGRDLPWRHPEAGPWGVLVSEIMLQQTPVVRVLPVYLRWMERWPTPDALAADSPGDAVRAWDRLGYPRRALRLHAAATAITVDHGGTVPDSVETLLTLPGVGEYTARAIAAFAFGARTPVIDTNVRRVLSRVERGVDSIREPATAADRRELETLLPAEPAVAARFSAAVMELGALVCSAANPRCADCPLADRCAWHLAGHPAAVARRAVQTWHGTDRQVRGRMMALVRADHGAVARALLLAVTDDAVQATRSLDSLVADGLLVTVDGGRAYALPD
ncbi:HhH-GPD family protein [Nakamurella alba]